MIFSRKLHCGSSSAYHGTAFIKHNKIYLPPPLARTPPLPPALGGDTASAGSCAPTDPAGAGSVGAWASGAGAGSSVGSVGGWSTDVQQVTELYCTAKLVQVVYNTEQYCYRYCCTIYYNILFIIVQIICQYCSIMYAI